MIEDKNLESILENRKYPEPSTNLSHRIISAAQRKPATKWDDLSLTQTILRLFIIPKPAYAMALLLFVGVLLGANIQQNQISDQELFTVLDFEQEEWL